MLNEQEIAYCENAINAGFLLHPVNRKKEPEVMWKDTFTKEKRLEWIRDLYLWGVGIACMSDFVCFDFDSDGEVLVHQFIGRICQERPELVNSFFLEKSPNGYHIVFRTQDSRFHSDKLAWRNGDPTRPDPKHEGEFEKEKTLLIETRAGIAYFVTYPSPGYIWLSYTLDDGTRIAVKPVYELPLVTESDLLWLCDVARGFDTYVPTKKPGRVLMPEQRAERNARERVERRKGRFLCDPMDYYGEAFTREQWENLLKEEGWKGLREDGEGRIFYQRPGKRSNEDDHSANLKEVDGCWMLYVYSTNCGLPTEVGLPAWKFLCYLEGFASDDSGEVTGEEIRQWKHEWYQEQKDFYEDQWAPLAEYLENKQWSE